MEGDRLQIYLREKRLERGMSMKELAKKSGVSKGTISKIENKEMIPGLKVIARLCLAMKLELNELVDIHK